MSAHQHMHRKYGVNLVQAPIIANYRELDKSSSDDNNNNQVIMSSSRKSAVETFLDDNGDFLEDYVQRKVHRSQLEKWLFRTSSSIMGGGRRESSALMTNANSPPKSASDQSLLQQIKRQRSRSFTPLRKLSASRFEESGLVTPILSKDPVDGQVSFLRTTPRNLTAPEIGNAEVNFGKCDKEQKLAIFLEVVFRESSLGGIASKACRGLKNLFGADHATVLVTSPPNQFSGDQFSIGSNDELRRERATSGRLMTAVITSKQTLNVESPDIVIDENEEVGAVMLAPILGPESIRRVMGAIRLARFKSKTQKPDSFSSEDEELLKTVGRILGTALKSSSERREAKMELARSEVFLELARAVFGEKSRLEPTMRTILTNFLTVIECERVQILLTSNDDPNVFRRVFDLQREDLKDDGELMDEGVIHEARFPINAMITGQVAQTGSKINIADMAKDERFDPNLNSDAGLTYKSLLSMPILEEDTGGEGGVGRVLGVISLINKEKGGVFTENDERFAEAFSLFCGMAIRNAAAFERAAESEAKLQVAFDTMNFQASSTEEEARALAKVPVPSAETMGIESFKFNYLSMADGDSDTYKATIRMFTDLGLLSRFNIDYTTFCRWILTVKKNYRNETVVYHNWNHAFNVAQMMFCMLRETGWDEKFTKVEILGLMVACLSHDLDHRGTTNSFQIKSKNPLATLYTSSTLERHHLNQCLLLLNIPGNRLLENLSEEEYSSVLTVIERSILATDLANHFKSAPRIRQLSTSPDGLEFGHTEHKSVLQCAMMTAADLGASTKPWAVHSHVSKLIAEEFWAQGDLEREAFDERPSPMMDRDASLALVQIDFLDGICRGLYEDMSRFSPALTPLIDGCMSNRERWEEVEQERGEDDSRSAKAAARNL